jgi:hypothetical protein
VLAYIALMSRVIAVLAATLALGACGGGNMGDDDDVNDEDLDGVPADMDCNDSDRFVYPDAPEVQRFCGLL